MAWLPWEFKERTSRSWKGKAWVCTARSLKRSLPLAVIEGAVHSEMSLCLTHAQYAREAVAAHAGLRANLAEVRSQFRRSVYDNKAARGFASFLFVGLCDGVCLWV
mmetsp:Transcript_121999/g.242975  ORF Transcript_121999/g.242975 Transcript_121999/m.242975 type:complete len:106 (+) Transcript_121999:1307-1624(+)